MKTFQRGKYGVCFQGSKSRQVIGNGWKTIGITEAEKKAQNGFYYPFYYPFAEFFYQRKD